MPGVERKRGSDQSNGSSVLIDPWKYGSYCWADEFHLSSSRWQLFTQPYSDMIRQRRMLMGAGCIYGVPMIASLKPGGRPASRSGSSKTALEMSISGWGPSDNQRYLRHPRPRMSPLRPRSDGTDPSLSFSSFVRSLDMVLGLLLLRCGVSYALLRMCGKVGKVRQDHG